MYSGKYVTKVPDVKINARASCWPEDGAANPSKEKRNKGGGKRKGSLSVCPIKRTFFLFLMTKQPFLSSIRSAKLKIDEI